MTETGKIREINGNLVVIDIEKINKSETCFGCLKTECKNCKISITAENTAALPLQAGQTVEVEAARKIVKAAE